MDPRSPQDNPEEDALANPALDPTAQARDRQLFRQVVSDISRNNLLGHCHDCGAEWVSSAPSPCPECQGRQIEWIFCWQFPDD